MPTYSGTPLSELIPGSLFSDLMLGLAGSDTLNGGPGSNTLDGGTGSDKLNGGGGNDTFVVDVAGDVITDSGGNDDRVVASISIDLKNDTLYGDVEHATLTGVAALNATGDDGANMLIGNAGLNKLNGGLGADTLIGGAGNDTYTVDDDLDEVIEYADGGIDLVVSSADTTTLGAFVENLTLTGFAEDGIGNALANKIIGNAGVNELSGLAGNDTLIGTGGGESVLDGGTGADSMVGGNGRNVYVVDDAGDKVVEIGSDAADDGVLSSISYVLGAKIEDLTLDGVSDIDGTGNSLNNEIAGNDGSNVLRGLAGDDYFRPGAGDDLMLGGDGNDTVFLSSKGSDTFIGGAGSDICLFEPLGLSGADTFADFSGLPGGDRLDISLLGVGTLDEKNVGQFLSTVTANGSTTVFVDSDGGGAGAPVALIELQGVTTDLDGLLANGAITGTSIPIKTATTLTAGNDPYTVIGTSELVFGLAGNDTLTGGAGSDTLDGGKGSDKLDGGLGNDTFVVDAAGDVIADSGGTDDRVVAAISIDLTKDSLYGGIEHATLSGVAALNATGDGGANMLIGNAGINKLDGGTGADTLIGGAGNDIYTFDDKDDQAIEYADGGIDTIVSSAIDTFLGAYTENLTLTGGAFDGWGNVLANKIAGSTGSNILHGLDGNDTLIGNDGNDGLMGDAGADNLIGGKGNDTYYVDDAGDKVIEAGAAADSDKVVSTISYVLGANIENLELVGASAIDGTGNSLNNGISGNGSNNLLRGLAGNDTLDGSLGDDLILGGDGSDVLLFGAADSDKMIGGNGSDTFQAKSFASGSSNLIADFNASPGGDQLDIALLGLGSIDETNVGLFLSTVTAKGSTTVFVDLDGGGGGAPLSLVELQGVSTDLDGLLANGSIIGVDIPSKAPTSLTALGTAYNVIGTSELVFGLAGNDTLTGGAGSDTLDGGKGNDKLDGGAGDDVLVVDSLGDVIADSGGANDRVVASISIDLTKDSLYGGIEHATLAGVAALNVIGDDGANMLIGNAGINKLDGGKGDDTLIGGAGNDVYTRSENGDTIVEYADGGVDLVLSSANFTLLSAYVENLTLTGPAAVFGTGNDLANKITGNSGANNLSGESGNDTLVGNDGDDNLNGGAGTDSMIGGNGSDTYVVDNAADKIAETGAASDLDTVMSSISYALGANLEDLFLQGTSDIDGTGNNLRNSIVGNAGNNLLRGLGGNDGLSGGDGDDLLLGGDGNDFLVGSGGDNTLVGGNGSDFFQVGSGPAINGFDVIADFNGLPGGDILEVVALGFDPSTSNINDFVQTVTLNGSTTVRVDRDGALNGANFVEVAVLQGVSTDVMGLLNNGSLSITD